MKLAGRHTIVALQEVQSWPSHEHASIHYWQWRHDEVVGMYARVVQTRAMFADDAARS